MNTPWKINTTVETWTARNTGMQMHLHIVTHKSSHTHTHPPTHLPNVSAGSWLKCQAMCMAAFRLHLSPYFTAAPGGDKKHRGARLPSRSIHHILPAPSCRSRLSNWWCLSCQSLRGFRYSTKAKEHHEWKAPSQIDFKLNQTPVLNYLSGLPLRNFKVAEKEQGKSEEREKRMVGAECKWLCPCMVSEQVAQW